MKWETVEALGTFWNRPGERGHQIQASSFSPSPSETPEVFIGVSVAGRQHRQMRGWRERDNVSQEINRDKREGD